MWTEKSKYYFPYIVTIKNNGTRPVQLKDRHWIITEMDGHVIEVEGQGKMFRKEKQNNNSYFSDISLNF